MEALTYATAMRKTSLWAFAIVGMLAVLCAGCTAGVPAADGPSVSSSGASSSVANTSVAASSGSANTPAADVSAADMSSASANSVNTASAGSHSQAAFEAQYPIATSASTTKVIFDTDFTYMNDDMLALFDLLQADACGWADLLGITTVGGNAFVAPATYDALSVLDDVGRADIPVCEGSDVPLAGFKDLDQEFSLIGHLTYLGAYADIDRYTTDYAQAVTLASTDLAAPTIAPSDESAVDFMIREVHAHPGQVTILAVGACTNVAEAIQKDPTLADDAAGIIYMGGVFDVPGQDLPSIEYNWWYDPEAVDVCLHAAWRKQTIVPHDVGAIITHGADVYERLRGNDTTELTSLLVKHLSAIYDAGMTEDPVYCWDPAVVATLLCPSLVTDEETRDVAIITARDAAYGSSFAWKEGTGPDSAVACSVVFALDRVTFWEFTCDLYAIDTTGYDMRS